MRLHCWIGAQIRVHVELAEVAELTGGAQPAYRQGFKVEDGVETLFCRRLCHLLLQHLSQAGEPEHAAHLTVRLRRPGHVEVQRRHADRTRAINVRHVVVDE